jgi:hypothetical protein
LTDTSRKFESEEPSLSNKELARSGREIFVALVQSGPTEAQALQMVGTMLGAAIVGSK